MQYCVLIELGQTTVTFSAYTGGDDGFKPYGDSQRPLAVWFSGSSVIIGRDADEQAIKGTPNAFRDLFRQMKSIGHFDYANEVHDYNKLVLFTLRAGLKEFFSDRLLNSQGTLEDNIGNLPLLLMFGADMDDDMCAVVESQLRDNGFGNVLRVHEDDYVLRTLPAMYSQNRLVLSSDGDWLFGDIYVGRKQVSSFKIADAGRDPRVNKLADLIWERTQAENDWLDFKKELPELQRAANRFILSDDSTFDGDVLLSNGQHYHYYLERADLRQFNQKDDAELLRTLYSYVSEFTNRDDCCVILKGQATMNKYLIEKLKPNFSQVLVDNKLMDASRSLLLEECKALDFKFAGGKAKVRKAESVEVVNKAPDAGAQPAQSAKVTAPTKRDERDFKMLKLDVETHLANGRNAQAAAAVKSFLDAMHTKGVDAFDSEAAALLKTAPAETKASKAADAHAQSAEPTGKERRAMRILEATVNTLLANGQAAKAKAEIAAFRKEMHANGITAFDVDLDNMVRSAVPAKSDSKTVAPTKASVQTTEPTGKDKRDMRMLEATVSTLITKGQAAKAKVEIAAFRKEMHAKGITAFDAQLDQLTQKVN